MSTIYFGCVDLAIELLVLTVVDIIVEVIIASALASAQFAIGEQSFVLDRIDNFY